MSASPHALSTGGNGDSEITISGLRHNFLNVYMDGGDATERLRQLQRITAYLRTLDVADPLVLFGDWNMVMNPAVDAIGTATNPGGDSLMQFVATHGLIDVLSDGQKGVATADRHVTDMTWAPRGVRSGPVIHKRLDFFLLNSHAWDRTSGTRVWDCLHTFPPWFTIPDPVTGLCTGKHTDHSTVTLRLRLRTGAAAESTVGYKPKRMDAVTAQVEIDGQAAFTQEMKMLVSAAVQRMRAPGLSPAEVQRLGDKAVDAVYKAFTRQAKRVADAQTCDDVRAAHTRSF